MKFADDVEQERGAGITLLAKAAAADDSLRVQVEGETYPRATLDPTQGLLVGDGVRVPGPIGNGVAPSRLTVRGHSYASDRSITPYGGTHIWLNPGDQAHDGAAFSTLMRDIVASGPRRWMEVNVPPVAAGLGQTTVLGEIPEDCVIEGVWYIPAASVVGANVNTRKHEIQSTGGILGLGTFGLQQYDLGNDLTVGVPKVIYSPLLADSNDSARARSAPTTLSANPLWFPAYAFPLGGAAAGPNVLMWVSSAVGGGLADPGGQVIVRLGLRYRNLAQDGAVLGLGGVYQKGWGAAFAQHRAPIAFGVEVAATGASAVNGATVACTALSAPIPNGWKIRFSGGAIATTNGVTAISATTINLVTSGTPALQHGAIAAGEHGFATPGISVDAYDSLTADGIYAWMVGLNDAAADRPFWRELVRSVIAADSCPFIGHAGMGNHVAAAGNGAGAAWASHVQPPSGQWLIPDNRVGPGTALKFTGAIGATPPSIVLKTSPAFRGTTLDLFFVALGGTGRGARASIVVDGQAAKIIDTSGGFVSGGFTPLVAVKAAVSTAAGSPTLGGGGFTSGMIGKQVEAATIPAGRHITAVALDGSTATINDGTGVTFSASTALTIVSYVPMVKRLTGLTPGAHTVTITLTGIDATDGSAAFIYLGYGFEVNTPVFWGNIPQIPSSGVTQVVADCNTDSAAVIAGTAVAPGTGTIEPAFSDAVQYLDLDALLNLDTSLFLGDGKHPNTAGIQLIHQAFATRISRLPRAQLLAR